jgi:hypothetical protein
VQIRVVYFEGCPHADEARRRLLEVLGDGSAIEMRCVADASEAEREHLHGSPTILIDGIDPFIAQGAAPTASWSCRLYDTETGPAGVPSLAQLRAALHRAAY